MFLSFCQLKFSFCIICHNITLNLFFLVYPINETYFSLCYKMFKSVFISLRLSYSKTQHLRALYFSSQTELEQLKKPENVVNVAIIGAPNSGKSTLINHIVQRKICASSNKVHTTTKLARAMCVHNNTHIVFLDTPGIVTIQEQKKYKLPDSMIQACQKSLRCANVIGVVHDVSNKWTKDTLNKDVLHMLQLAEGTPSFLILNKIDQLNAKKHLLSVIRNLTNGVISGRPIPNADKEKIDKKTRGYDKFSDVFLVSALNGDGVQDIKEYLVANAKPASCQFDPNNYTDQSPESLIQETVRAKFLDFLSQEIPYKLSTRLEYYEEDPIEDKIICSIRVECPSERLARLINGAGGGRLQQIKSFTRSDLMELFKKPVVLDISLTVAGKSIAIINSSG